MKKMIVFFLLMVVVLLSACNNSTEQEVPSTPAAPMVPTATPGADFVAEEPLKVSVTAILGENDNSIPSSIYSQLPAYIYMTTEKEGGEWSFIRRRYENGLEELPQILAAEAVTTFKARGWDACSSVRSWDFTRPGPDCSKEEVSRGIVEYFPRFENCTYEEPILECEYTHSDRFSEDSTLYVRYDMFNEEVYILLDVSVTTVKMLQELNEFFKWGGLPSVVESDVLYTIYPHYDN